MLLQEPSSQDSVASRFSSFFGAKFQHHIEELLVSPTPNAVILLGFVSFFTDASSDLIYPLLPLFLTEVLHAGAGLVGAENA